MVGIKILLLIALLRSPSAFRMSKMRVGRRSELSFANENEQDQLEKIDKVFQEVRAASESGKRNMIREGKQYIVDTEKIAGRLAMMIFSVGLVLEFTSGESFLQQFQDGMYNMEKYAGVTASAFLGVVIMILGTLRDKI